MLCGHIRGRVRGLGFQKNKQCLHQILSLDHIKHFTFLDSTLTSTKLYELKTFLAIARQGF